MKKEAPSRVEDSFTVTGSESLLNHEKPSSITMKLTADTSVIQPLLDKLDKKVSSLDEVLSKRVAKAFGVLLDSGNLFLEISTIQPDKSCTGASELLVTFYPTERFLVFARAVLTSDFDSLTIKN